jgi:hypothetical protein
MLICKRLQNYLHVVTNSEAVLQEIGPCWRLHDESQWAERSRFDVLSILNIDLRDTLEAISVNYENVVSLWDPNVAEENLEVIEINLETVYGVNYVYDSRALIRVIKSEHPTLLEVVVSVLKQQYGDFGQWRHEARRRAAQWATTRPAIDWHVLPFP